MENNGQYFEDTTEMNNYYKIDRMNLTPTDQRWITLGISVFFFLIFVSVGFVSWLPLQYVVGVFVSLWGVLLSASLSDKIQPYYDNWAMVWRAIGFVAGIILFVIGIIYEIIIIIHH